MNNEIYEFTVKDSEGKDFSISSLKGKAVLVVNVASKCGFTPQYKGLESLYKRFKDKGLEIIGFPCDQFLHQEPGNMDEIKQFCSLTYDVTFPIMNKINVNGRDADPFYAYLKSKKKGNFGGAIKWNFTKFLIDREGTIIKRFAPYTAPEKLIKYIEEIL